MKNLEDKPAYCHHKGKLCPFLITRTNTAEPNSQKSNPILPLPAAQVEALEKSSPYHTGGYPKLIEFIQTHCLDLPSDPHTASTAEKQKAFAAHNDENCTHCRKRSVVTLNQASKHINVEKVIPSPLLFLAHVYFPQLVNRFLLRQ